MTGHYLRRYVDAYLDRVFAELPAIMVTGPRGCGKTTTALRRASSIVRLDEPDEARAFAGVRARHSAESWPGTGRVTPVPMFGLAVGELEQTAQASSYVDRLFMADVTEMGDVSSAPTLFDYVDLAMAGGFPGAANLSPRGRLEWYEGYVEQLVGRDIAALAQVRAPRRLADLLRAVALNTAGQPTLQTLTAAGGIDVKTARTYLDLLEDAGTIERLPSWHSNRLSRLVKGPKYHVVDTGMAMWLAGVDGSGITRSAELLGRVLDSFVVAQIRPLLRLSRTRAVAYHLRDNAGRHEVDLLLETRGGDLVGLEVKAGSGPTERDARHLAWLRDEVGAAFVRGVVLHTGRHTFPLGQRIWATPIASIWS